MKHLTAALAAIQHLFVVEKRNVNPLLNSKYADYADVRFALDPKLREHGIAISFYPGALRSDGGVLIQTLALNVWHLESGEHVSVTGEFPVPDSNKGTNRIQCYGSALTFSMRFMLTTFFGIVTGDDDDARRASAMIADNGRDGAPSASDTGHWSRFMEGHWAELAAPEGGCSIGELPLKQRSLLASKYPTNVGLTAWLADSRLSGHLSELGYGWDDFTARAGGVWPEKMEHCDHAQVRAAATAAKAMLTTAGGQQ